MWTVFYISWFLLNLSKIGWITLSNAMMYHFVTFCCAPVLLSTIYFMRNPKHLISVLQDHNLTISPNLATLNKNEQSRQRV